MLVTVYHDFDFFTTVYLKRLIPQQHFVFLGLEMQQQSSDTIFISDEYGSLQWESRLSFYFLSDGSVLWARSETREDTQDVFHGH